MACLLLTLMPSLGFSLPLESRVPGGIALVRLGSAAPASPDPRVWLDEQPIWVTRRDNEWIAIVGIGLDTPAGSRELRVEGTTAPPRIRFEIGHKHYPEQHITLKERGRVRLSPENEVRAEREIARIQQLKRHWRDAAETDSNFRQPAEGRLSINLRPGIPTDWRIKRVEHRLGAQGYTTQVECERFTAAPVPITATE